MYRIFGHGHYDIFILKQNNLLIIKVLSNLLLEKLVNSPKIVLWIKLTFNKQDTE